MLSFLGIDENIWKFINTFAPWLSALGTLAVVITSLYLAMRDRRIRLKVKAGFRRIVAIGQTLNQGANVISIYVTNTGYRSVTIIGLYWKFGIFRKRIYEQTPGYDFNSSSLPVKLADGEEASYHIPEIFFKRNLTTLEQGISKEYLKLGVKFIKIGVYTTLGKTFEYTIEKGLQTWFINNLYIKDRE
jgi:hypothetical protein